MIPTHRPLAAAALALLLVAAPRHAGAQCMLANPSFELSGSGGTVFGGWSQFGPVGSSTRALHGARAARVTGPHTGGWDVAGFWQSQDCSPGERWAASVHVLHAAATPLVGQSQAIVNVEWRDAAGALISYESHAAADAATPHDEWIEYAFETQPAPAGTASLHYLVGVLQAPADPTPQVLFDAVTCVSLGPPTLASLQWNDFPGGRTVEFSGRTWRVKGPGYYGPGPNHFDDGPAAVWVDAARRFHMTIHRSGSIWYSSEVTLADALGYGDYIFTTRGRVDALDRNTVLGMFLWEYGSCYDTGYLWWNPYNEIDIEFSRWGNAFNPVGQFAAQPADWGGNLFRFNAAFGDTELSSHAMRWLPGSVAFRSWRGGPADETPASTIASWTYSGPHLPRPESPRVHLNLWQLAAPAATQEAVFDSFTFRPCPDGVCGVVAVDPPAAAPAPRSTAAPNPFTARTTIRYSIPIAGPIDLAVFDLAGRRLRSLASGPAPAGSATASWDGRNERGERVPAGVYFYRLRTVGRNETRRLVVLE